MFTGVSAAYAGATMRAQHAVKVNGSNPLMKRFALPLFAALALTFAALIAFAKGALAHEGIHVSNVFAGVSHVAAARTGAVYFTISNHGKIADALVGLTTDAADAAELHESRNENNIMHMRMVKRLALFPGDDIDLRAMGMHVMLVGLKAPLKPGDTVKLELSFEKSPRMIVDAVVGDQPVHAEHGPEAEHEVENTGQ
jgi:copper(I)-binding protein